MGLFSTKFGTCLGVAIVGTGSAKTRFMVHLIATSWWRPTFNTFAANVKAASLSNMRVVLRTPDLTAGLPDQAAHDAHGSLGNGVPVWTAQDTVAAQAVIDEVKAAIVEEFGISPQVESSPMVPIFLCQGDAGTMEVSGLSDLANIYVDGVMV